MNINSTNISCCGSIACIVLFKNITSGVSRQICLITIKYCLVTGNAAQTNDSGISLSM